MPLSVHHSVNHPVTLYAATKKANELMAHSYSHLYSLPTTGLRFFTVYGPWGRLDMAISLFVEAIVEGREFPVCDDGGTAMDFTYIDDAVEIVIRVNDEIAEANKQWSATQPDPASSSAPFRIYNVGNGSPTKLSQIIKVLEAKLALKAKRDMQPKRSYDVVRTFADADTLEAEIGISPRTSLEFGIAQYVRWYPRCQVRRRDSLTYMSPANLQRNDGNHRQAEALVVAGDETTDDVG